jgi:hypothetical protein
MYFGDAQLHVPPGIAVDDAMVCVSLGSFAENGLAGQRPPSLRGNSYKDKKSWA